MDPQWRDRLSSLATAHLADACARLNITPRCAPFEVRGISPTTRCMGPARPAIHKGGIDAFLEAIDVSSPGDVLVIDNDGRVDEACVGDLIALEAKTAGLAGIVIWGLHRDTAELLSIGMPVFSIGSIPAAPSRRRGPDLAQRSNPHLGNCEVQADDLIAADADGVILFSASAVQMIVEQAEAIRSAEQARIQKLQAGASLRDQLHFREFKSRRESEPTVDFREHLQSLSPGSKEGD